MNEEQPLLDELEDARLELARCRRGWIIIVGALASALTFFTAGLIVGMWSTAHRIDLGGQAAAFIVIGVIGCIVSACASFAWFEQYEAPNSPRKNLRTAERAYRDFLLNR